MVKQRLNIFAVMIRQTIKSMSQHSTVLCRQCIRNSKTPVRCMERLEVSSIITSYSHIQADMKFSQSLPTELLWSLQRKRSRDMNVLLQLTLMRSIFIRTLFLIP